MTSSTRNILFAALLGAATAASAADEDLLGPMASDLRNRVGRWCVEAHLQLTPEARPAVINAVAESRLVGGRWLVTEMRGRGFEGDRAQRLRSPDRPLFGLLGGRQPRLHGAGRRRL